MTGTKKELRAVIEDYTGEIGLKILNKTLDEIDNDEIDLEKLTQEISHDQAEFISTVFQWQCNMEKEVFEEYSNYLYVVYKVMEIIESIIKGSF